MSSQSVAESLQDAVKSFCTLLERRLERLSAVDHLETVQHEEADARAARIIGERLAELALAVPDPGRIADLLRTFRHHVGSLASAPIRQHLPREYARCWGDQVGLQLAVTRACGADLLRQLACDEEPLPVTIEGH